jgi:hypothetical protein
MSAAGPPQGRVPRLHAGLRRHGRHEEALRLATPRPARPNCSPSGGSETARAASVGVV